IYSARKGTPAYSMEGHIPYEEQSARFTRMLALQSEISVNRNRDYEGKPTRVLVEGRSKTDDNKLTGRNEKNRLVHFEGPDSLIGQFADVMITKAETYALFGELMEG
ncbi:MAG: TRAM domain-containing protein, partial [Ruminiclostridium sp.]|nr:TRAM domain-containing protein [Ruminiclostridium sp.]